MDDMKTHWTSRPTEQVLAAIQALDVEPVKVRMMDPVRGEGWTRERADAVEITYKNFLSMLVKHPEEAEEIAMSEDTDEFWHTHILQTRKYADDCEEMFGTYLHHSPHLEDITSEYMQKKVASVEKTRRLYAEEFGAEMDAAWAPNVAEAQDVAASAASIRAAKAAASAASIRTGNAAASAASIHAKNAAASAASIRVGKVAASAASIRTGNAAASAASIHAKNAAASAASIRVGKAAASAASIRVGNSARASNTAMLMAA
jgi:hypothetical protein